MFKQTPACTGPISGISLTVQCGSTLTVSQLHKHQLVSHHKVQSLRLGGC